MIFGIVLDEPIVRTGFGREFRVSRDAYVKNGRPMPAQKNEPAIVMGIMTVKPGDRVVLEYRTGASYGLWFIVRNLTSEAAN